MDEAVLLSALRIEEVSGVDAPATGISGWMVAKRGERSLTAALAPSKPARKFHISWGGADDVLAAMTHFDSPVVTVLKRDGARVEIRKDALDPAERAAEVSSSASAPSVVKALPRPAAQHANPVVRENVAALLAQLADALGVSLDELVADTLRGDPSSVVKGHGFRFFTS